MIRINSLMKMSMNIGEISAGNIIITHVEVFQGLDVGEAVAPIVL